jgi:hypothetical protein
MTRAVKSGSVNVGGSSSVAGDSAVSLRSLFDPVSSKK